MGDRIERMPLIEQVQDWIYSQTVSKYLTSAECRAVRKGAEKVSEIIMNAPAVDAVLVVRCSECKHDGNCFIKEMLVAEKANDLYCSCGERKGGIKDETECLKKKLKI